MNRFILILKKILNVNIPIILIIGMLTFILRINILYFIKFIISTIFITIGVSLYLTGYDMSYTIISDKISHSLLKKKNIIFIITICLLLSFILSVIEPELIKVSPSLLLLVILSLSISIFFCVSIYRIITKTNFKYYLIFSYLIVFILIIFTNFHSLAFSFDRASLATGLVSSPFLITMGMSFSKRTKRPKKDHTSFGILGLCSIGPLLIFLILGIFSKTYNYHIELSNYNIIKYTFISILLILLYYLVFIRFNFKKYKKDIFHIIKGLLLVLIGIISFIMGSSYGYIEFAKILGNGLINYSYFLTIIVAALFGFLITKIEPSFNFLMNYVNQVTNGGIKEDFLEFFLSLGVSLALILCIFISKSNIDVLVFLIPCFFLAVFLAFFVPNRFLAIAFDSLGAVIGIISTSFFIPFITGVGNINTFGMLALIGIIPVIFLEIAGFIYEKEELVNDYSNLDDRIVDYD